MQWIWKVGSLTACTFQFAASLAITLIVALRKVAIHGISTDDEDLVRESWEGKPLVYKRYTLLWVLVAFCWVELGFVVWR